MNAIDKLINDYNEIPQLELKENDKLKDYTPEAIKLKLAVWKQGKINPILNQVESLKIKTESGLNELKTKALAKKYPLRFSVLNSDKTLGELQRSNAFQFLNSVKDLSLIKAEIDNSITANQTDYSNSLIETILANKPDELKLSQAGKPANDFYKYVSSLVKNDNEFNVKEFELKESLKELNYINDAIQSGDAFLITPKAIKQMKQNEVNKISAQYLNRSMKYI